MSRTFRKFMWGCLFALVFAAGFLTSFAPSAEETCCKKTCQQGSGAYKGPEMCCKEGSC
jgi:hypothetical protein